MFYHFSRWRQVIFPEEPCQKVSIIIDIIILHREPIPILTRMKLCKKARIHWHLWSAIIVISIDTTTIIAQLVKAGQWSIFERIWLLGYRVQEITEDAIIDRYLRLPLSLIVWDSKIGRIIIRLRKENQSAANELESNLNLLNMGIDLNLKKVAGGLVQGNLSVCPVPLFEE